MARLRRPAVAGTLTSFLDDTSTTIASPNFVTLPEITSPDYAAIILDPNYENGSGLPPEVCYVVYHEENSTTVTVTRGEETATGVSAAREHEAGVTWFHGPTLEDYGSADGVDGQSAYQVAVGNGYSGTEEEWLDSLTGESAYQLAVDNGFSGTEEEWLDSLVATATTIPTLTYSADHTLVAADAGHIIEIDEDTDVDVNIELDADEPIPVDSVFEICQLGAGQVHVTWEVGVTVVSANGFSIAAQYGSASLRKRGTDEWIMTGYTE